TSEDRRPGAGHQEQTRAAGREHLRRDATSPAGRHEGPQRRGGGRRPPPLEHSVAPRASLALALGLSLRGARRPVAELEEGADLQVLVRAASRDVADLLALVLEDLLRDGGLEIG